MSERLTGALAAIGLDPADIPGRVELFRRVLTTFETSVGREPAWHWWVPGRIEVFGKHTDYAGGRSLVAAVPRGFAIAAAPRGDALVVARDARWDASSEIRLDDPERAYTGWANYVAVVARRLAADFPGAPLGCDITFASDLPRAAGVSSSSALVVGIALALIERASLRERREWSQSITTKLELGGYLGAVENGLGFGQFVSGVAGVGTHGGSEDHTAILNSRPDEVCAFSYVPVREGGSARLPDEWRFVIMPSGIEASKAGAVKDRYNALSLATRELAGRLGSDPNRPRTLGAIVRDDPGAIARLERAVAGGPLATRLAHFVAEDARVPRALDAFARADAAALGALADASQRDASAWLQNQIPETIDLAAMARAHGAFAASSFGAGFGGSVWALTDTAGAPAFLDRWRTAYLARHPQPAPVHGFIARPAPPAAQIL